MQVSVRPHEGGWLVEATLVLEDLGCGDGPDNAIATLTAKMTIPAGEVLETLTDPAKTRSVAATLVGRMTTGWKLGLIETIGSGVVEALRGAVAGSIGSGAAED